VQGRRRVRRLREQASLLDLTHDTIFVRGMDDVIRYWNLGAEELYGWTAAVAIGRTSHDLLQTRFPAPIEAINAELGETGRWEGELVHTRRDGSEVVVASRWSLQRDGEGRPALVLETNNDVTSRRQAEYLMGQVFDAVPDGMCVIGPDFRVQRANPRFARHHGLTPESVIGAHLVELGGRELFERIAKPNVSRALAGEETTYSAWLPTPRGGRRYLRITYSPLHPNSDRVEAVLLVGRDHTNEMRAAEALQAAQADLAHANRIATMGQLTASIAHEVSQPIHAVALSARAALRWLAADPPANEEVHDALARVVHNASLAGEVLARIRNLVRKAPPRRESFALDEAIRDVLALTASEADKSGITVERCVAPDVPPVFGDRVQLQQVILNLVMNGIEAMSGIDEGPQRLCVRAEPRSEDGVVVQVADTGQGLAKETARRLFEPFFTTKPHGMGMGLSICRSIVEAHGGQLSASPNEPRGTVFEFTLPAEVDGAAAEVNVAERDPA
jgi:PAS domain S-box-containing protein